MIDYEKKYHDLLKLCGEVRDCQKKYFKNRTPDALDASKAKERELDQVLLEEKWVVPEPATLPLFPDLKGGAQ